MIHWLIKKLNKKKEKDLIRKRLELYELYQETKNSLDPICESYEVFVLYYNVKKLERKLGADKDFEPIMKEINEWLDKILEEAETKMMDGIKRKLDI